MGNSVVGVDIGSSGLRAVEVRDPDKSRPTVIRAHEVRVPEGAISRGEVLEPHTVATALKQLWSAGGFKSKNIVLGMGNQRVLSRDLSVPKASLKAIRESLPFQVQDMLPVPVADALLDFYPISESTGEHGPVVNGLLIAAVKDAVTANVNAAHLAGLTPVDMDLIPFALSRLLMGTSESAKTVALVDVGASTTGVIISTNGIPQFVRIIPAGSNDVTKALSSRLEVDSDQAEILKRSLGLAKQIQSADEQKAVEIIYEVTGELLGSIRNTINYFTNTRPHDEVTHVILAGGGANLPGFADSLAVMAGVTVEFGDIFSSVAVSRDLKTKEARTNGANYGVALGLALGHAS